MNVVTFTGRLTGDPIRRDANKSVVCEFRLAVDSRPRLWIVVQTWGQLAGRCAQHLNSGRHVAVSGQLLCEEYVTRAGEKATRWFTRATIVTYLDQPAREGETATAEEVAR